MRQVELQAWWHRCRVNYPYKGQQYWPPDTDDRDAVCTHDLPSTGQVLTVPEWQEFTLAEKMSVVVTATGLLTQGQDLLPEGRLILTLGPESRLLLAAAARMTMASSTLWSSSSRESMACEISGFMDAGVWDRSSVPYRCLTNLGSSGWISFSHMSTMIFSTVGVISSSSVSWVPWWDMPLASSILSSMKATSLWYKSSWRSSASSFISDKSRKCDPDDWNPKWNRIAYQMSFRDVECFTIVLREITRQ